MSQTVKFEYFKASGKYYSEGEVEVPKDMPMHRIFEMARMMMDFECPPGLIPGGTRFHARVTAPGHEHDHPLLIVAPPE